MRHIHKNLYNARQQMRTISGHKGVDFVRSGNNWRARVGEIHVGKFATMEEAIEAREVVAREIQGEFKR